MSAGARRARRYPRALADALRPGGRRSADVAAARPPRVGRQARRVGRRRRPSGRSTSAARAGRASARRARAVPDRARSCEPAIALRRHGRPLAAARGLSVELRDELSEERQDRDGIALVRSLAGQNVVVCGHGGLESVIAGAPRWRKGTMFVVDDTCTSSRSSRASRRRRGARRALRSRRRAARRARPSAACRAAAGTRRG